MTSPVLTIARAIKPADIADVRVLFAEYITGLGVDLSFQDVAAELAGLPGKYAPPAGAVLLARDAVGQPVGCVALRPLAISKTCEIKRLYVRPQARGHDHGRSLAIEILRVAKAAGYQRAVLDSLAPMRAAQKLYASLGFRQVAPYYDNPVPGAIYMALDL